VDEAKAILNTALKRNIGGYVIHARLAQIALAQSDTTTPQREDALVRANPQGELGVVCGFRGPQSAMLSRMKRQLRRGKDCTELEQRKKNTRLRCCVPSGLDRTAQDETYSCWATRSTVPTPSFISRAIAFQPCPCARQAAGMAETSAHGLVGVAARRAKKLRFPLHFDRGLLRARPRQIRDPAQLAR